MTVSQHDYEVDSLRTAYLTTGYTPLSQNTIKPSHGNHRKARLTVWHLLSREVTTMSTTLW